MFYRTFNKYYIFSILNKKTPIGHILNFQDFYQDFSVEELTIFYQQIGKNVKKYRKEKKITQLQLALAIGHNSVGHVAKAELYKYGKHFNLEQLYKIAKILNVKIETLIGRETP